MPTDLPQSVHVEYTPEFKRSLRKLARKYRSIRTDVKPVIKRLQIGDLIGDQVTGTGNILFKARVRNSDIQKGKRRIVFVGPAVVKDFMDSIIRENALDLTLVGHCSCWESLRNYEPDSFDIAILFDGSRKDTRKIREEVGIPSRKLLPLW